MITTVRRFALPLIAVFLIAAAPSQAPGYFRMTVGSDEVIALYDGNLRMDPAILHSIKPAEARALLDREFVDTNASGVNTTINAFLVKTGGKLILVDTGSAGNFTQTAGHLIENLRAAGYRPEDVDAVLITHMHGDHIGGLAANGARVFPNAVIYAAKTEADFWLASPSNEPIEQWRKMARPEIEPYQAAGKFRTFEPGAVLFPGVTALDTLGHTAGHIAYLFESGGQGFVAAGDIVHMHAIQFARPEVSIDYDTDQPTAIATRKKLFEQISAKGWVVAGVHLPFPGVGNVRKDGTSYDYVPVKYRPLP